MIEKIVQENYNFCEPEKQTERGLEYNIPLYLKALETYISDITTKSNKVQTTKSNKVQTTKSNKVQTGIETFLYYLNTAFRRIEELNLTRQYTFISLGEKYGDFLKEYYNRLSPLAKGLLKEGIAISNKYA